MIEDKNGKNWMILPGKIAPDAIIDSASYEINDEQVFDCLEFSCPQCGKIHEKPKGKFQCKCGVEIEVSEEGLYFYYEKSRPADPEMKDRPVTDQ